MSRALAARKRRYRQYLQSPDWKALKARKAAASPKVCGGCGTSKGTLQLHHMVYRRSLSETKLDDLMWLCDECHGIIHRVKDKGKLRFKADTHSPALMAVMTKAAIKRVRASLPVPASRVPEAPGEPPHIQEWFALGVA